MVEITNMKISESRYFAEEIRQYEAEKNNPEFRAFLDSVLTQDDPHGVWTAREATKDCIERNEFTRCMLPADYRDAIAPELVEFETRCPLCGRFATFVCKDEKGTGMIIKRFRCSCGKVYLIGDNIAKDEYQLSPLILKKIFWIYALVYLLILLCLYLFVF